MRFKYQKDHSGSNVKDRMKKVTLGLDGSLDKNDEGLDWESGI